MILLIRAWPLHLDSGLLPNFPTNMELTEVLNLQPSVHSAPEVLAVTKEFHTFTGHLVALDSAVCVVVKQVCIARARSQSCCILQRCFHLIACFF